MKSNLLCDPPSDPQSANNEEKVRKNSYEDNMSKFRELLMRENLDIVGRLKKYKKTDFRRKIVLDQWKELKRLSELSKVWVSVPFIKQKFDEPVITVDSSKAGSNIDALRLAINDLGWKEYPNGCVNKSCHVVWNSCNFNENRNNAGSFVNKHPGITQCLHKVAFSRILETMRTLFPDDYSFYPLTWYLPHQLMEFSMFCKNRDSANKKERYYIVKPDAGTQGEGIYLIRKPEDYKMSSKSFVVQEYLAKPLLLDGYKFDLRIYSILLSLDPLKVYLCNEGLARFCTKRYIPPSFDNLNISYMHLTNYSLNKRSNEFVHTQKLDSGSKRTVSSVFAFLEAHGYDVGEIWQKLEELVYKTVLAIVPQLKVHYINEVSGKSDNFLPNHQAYNDKNRPSCFQILGFDVLIMENLQPFLLEVNSNPSMRLDCEMEIAPGICEYYVSKVDVKIKKPLVRDTLKLLQQDICMKYNLNYKDSENCKPSTNKVHDSLGQEDDVTVSRENSISTEKENAADICRKWSLESEYGPHFVEIAKKHNILPKYFETNRPNSTSSLTKEVKLEKDNSVTDIQVTVSGTSPQIRKKEQQERHEELAREKSWLNNENVESNRKNNMETIEESDGPNPQIKTVEQSARKSCLTLISTDSYKYLFEDLRILDETTIIFFNAMGHRYSDNMGSTCFRTFGRQCKLYELGFNHAMIDLIYIEVQRQWSFISNFDSKQGLCFQAFLEAFFRIAFTKFSDSPKDAAVQNLIQHCKKSIGLKSFNWARTLYSTSDQRQSQKNEIRNGIQMKNTNRYKILAQQNNNLLHQKSEPNSNSSESSFESVVESSKGKLKEKLKIYQMESRQTKYDIMKAIHEIYRTRFPNSRHSEIDYTNDSDSVKSFSSAKKDEKYSHKTPKLPYILRTENISSRYNKFQMSANSYEKSESMNHDRKSVKYSQRELKYKSESTPSPKNISENSGLKASSKNDKSSYVTKLSSTLSISDIKSGKYDTQSTKNQQLAPLNTKERMRKLIAVYGADSQNYLKRSLEKISKRYPTLKPI